MVESKRKGSLERVYREQYRPLVGFLFQRLRDHGRAEELAQEAFVRALQHRPANPRAWLYTVAANLARDEGRRRSVRSEHLQLVRAEADASEPSAQMQIEQRERAEMVRRVLGELAPRDREALLMRERGRSYEEIADELGLSAGSVGTTLARARKRLAEAWHQLPGQGETR